MKFHSSSKSIMDIASSSALTFSQESLKDQPDENSKTHTFFAALTNGNGFLPEKYSSSNEEKSNLLNY